jgi:hypothetical protein
MPRNALAADFHRIRPHQPMPSSMLGGIFFRACAALQCEASPLTRKSRRPLGDGTGIPAWFTDA